MRTFKKISALISILLCCQFVFAQTPQFAVVRPDGTTYICPTWDSAYGKSLDNDFIYLPGTTIANGITVNKKLNIIGTGHYPDSTQTTGITTINGSVSIFKKCYLEGLNVTGNINANDTSANNSTFVRLRCNSFVLGGSSSHFINGCVFQSLGGFSDQTYSCIISKTFNDVISNSIVYGGGTLWYVENSNINNCIFLSDMNNWRYFRTVNCTFSNNIFKGLYNIDWAGGSVCYQLVGNIFNNNIFTQNYLPSNSGNIANYLSVDGGTIFINQTGSGFNYSHNYHLLLNSPYLTAGTDGTQIGIYGGPQTYKEGAVPSNPHIYFKQVDANSTNDGKLHVKYKVRTQ